MTVKTAAGARLYIGPANETADELSEYEALSFTEVGEVEDLGELGDVFRTAEFVSLGDSRVRRLKTVKDGGTQEIVVGFDSGDAGQDALIAAFAVRSNYAFKITLDDAGSGSPSNPTTWYYRGQVNSNRRRIGSNENIVRLPVSVSINSDIIQQDAL